MSAGRKSCLLSLGLAGRSECVNLPLAVTSGRPLRSRNTGGSALSLPRPAVVHRLLLQEGGLVAARLPFAVGRLQSSPLNQKAIREKH